MSRFAEALLFIDVTAADEAAFVHARAARIDAAGKALLKLENFGPWLRLAWAVGGEGASFTFSAKLALKT